MSSTAAAQSCSFSMTDANFGSVDLTGGAAQTTTGTFTATCSGLPNATVRVCVSFNNGSGGAAASGSPRYMKNGTTPLTYDLFKDAGYTSVWGTTAGLFVPATLSVPLNSSGTGSVSQTVYGRIAAGQSTVPPGTYTSSFAGGETS
ncbi:MAG: spore coat U domain-containing protein, partial [Gemmataceae bacterium]|nr:spore coat U domain-containing protein [Gemmataceae bacterium]